MKTSTLLIPLLLMALALVACEDEPLPVPDPVPQPPQPTDTIVTPVDTGLYSGTLPVLFINTRDSSEIDSKEEYRQAQWWLDNQGDQRFESIGSKDAPLAMEIKGRGNATWTNLEKKPYRLKLNEKHKVLGMPSSRHWVLMANAEFWMGQLNDALPFEIGRRMGMAWNPRMQPVEVVLNGDYIGLYFLTEKIRVDKNRVNIKEQYDYETDPERITGGWLLEIDNYVEPGNISFIEGNGMPFWVTPHSPELLSPQQRDYITNFLTMADKAIYCSDKNSTEWEKYIDIDSLAIFYIVQEAVDNPEAFSGSCYMYKQQGADSKLIFGPLWDCGSSFHRFGSLYEFDEYIYENLPSYCRSRWISEIAKFPRFQQRVKYHWRRFYNDVYPAMEEFMEDFTVRIEVAGNCDHKRWPQYSSDNIPARMRAFEKPCFDKKVAWLNSQWGEAEMSHQDYIPTKRKF